MDPAQIIRQAIKDAAVDQDSPTRLATVTNGTATTINVQFDGEATPSTRAYVKMFAPVIVGDRVVMLRSGSTWVAVGRIPTASTGPDDGTLPCTPYPNVGLSPYGVPTSVHKRNGWVILRCEMQVAAILPAGSALFALPVGTQPTARVWLNTGSPFAAHRNYSLSVQTNGIVINQHDIPNTEVCLGVVTYPSPA